MATPKAHRKCRSCKETLPREQFYWNGRENNKRCIYCHERNLNRIESARFKAREPVPGDTILCRKCGELFTAFLCAYKSGKEYVSHLCEGCKEKSSLNRSKAQQTRAKGQAEKNAVARRGDEAVNTLWNQGMTQWRDLQFFVPGVGNLSGDHPQVCPLR